MVVSAIASSVQSNSWEMTSRQEMYSATDYREGRVLALAKDFPNAECRIDFLHGRTTDEEPNRGFN